MIFISESALKPSPSRGGLGGDGVDFPQLAASTIPTPALPLKWRGRNQ